IVFSKASLRDVSEQETFYPALGSTDFTISESTGFTRTKSLACDPLAWQANLIIQKIPLIGLAQSGLFLPHDLGLVRLGAVSFDKGCYLGQEIIARMHYKAKLKKETQSWVGTGVCPFDGELVNELEYQGKIHRLY